MKHFDKAMKRGVFSLKHRARNGKAYRAPILLSLLLVAVATFCFACPAIAADPDPLSTPPEHHKTITENEDGSYTVTLDVKGEASTITEQKNVDVVVVFDRSNSMANTSEGSTSTRVDVAKAAAKDFVSGILSTSGNRVAFVDFGTNATAYNNGDWYTDSTTLNSQIDSITANGGGTNWEDALTKAKGILDNDDSTNKKYVIFLSDGDPTYRNSKMQGKDDTCTIIEDQYGDVIWLPKFRHV